MTQPTTGIILMVTLFFVLASAAVAADTLTITARQAVVRAGPDSTQGILATVPPGTTLALLETREGWYKVLLDDGQEGWGAQSAAQVQEGRGFTVVPVGTAAAPGRTALVIGNAAYSEDIGALKNPSNDATDMAATLRQLGFAVTLVRDANHQRRTKPSRTSAGSSARAAWACFTMPGTARKSADATISFPWERASPPRQWCHTRRSRRKRCWRVWTVLVRASRSTS
jgi:hypothetical protein